MTPQDLQGCDSPFPKAPNRNIDKAAGFCDADGCPPDQTNQNTVDNLLGTVKTKKGLGQAVFCNPVSTGRFFSDSNNPDTSTIYRYSRAIRAVDEAVQDLFRDVVVEDEMGVYHPVPIMWGSQEKAVEFIVQDNIRKDNSLVVDRVKLPLMSIYNAGIGNAWGRYTYSGTRNHFRTDGKPGFTLSEKRSRDTILSMSRGIPVDISHVLTVWTMFTEDMNQIIEQILLKFDQLAYIRVQGVQWESVVRVDSYANNLDTEPGTEKRVVKYQINLTTETYIPQPIHRDKSVLSNRVEIVSGVDESEVREIISRIEIESKK